MNGSDESNIDFRNVSITCSKIANIGLGVTTELGTYQRIPYTADVLRSEFQVEAPVTRRSPYRSVREDFPHTVPQSPEALRLWLTQQDTQLGAQLCFPFLLCI